MSSKRLLLSKSFAVMLRPRSHSIFAFLGLLMTPIWRGMNDTPQTGDHFEWSRPRPMIAVA